jgi:Ca2+-binding EF-hand superfamily protein
LSAFTPAVRESLEAFDNNKNGFLDGDEILKAFQALDGLKSGAIPIDSFPPDIQPGLRVHDDGDGTLDAKEIAKAFLVLEETNKASQSGGIAISSFPEKAQEKLRALDGTGDGVIDAAEVLAGVEALHR